MRTKIAISGLALAAAGLTGVVTWPASAASASPVPAAAGALARPAADAAATLAKKNYFIVYFVSAPPGGHQQFACNGGATYHINSLDGLPEQLSARNNCSVRVWLNTQANDKGHNLCVRPHSTAILRRHYVRVWISRNTASC
jgi:hypothetical protein